MYFSSIHYWTSKLFIYWKLLPQFGTTCLISCRGCKRKWPRCTLAMPLCQNVFRSFSLTATTRISHRGISSHARTHCGCFDIATTHSGLFFWLI
jgi:hypothetical protein